MEKYPENIEDFQKASLEYSSKQAKELMDSNVSGLHFYILNKSETMLKLLPLIQK
jgi:5,10-methylenetetrahydrofolate reductase